MNVKEVAKMLSKKFVADEARDIEWVCSEELADLQQELEFLLGSCEGDPHMTKSILTIETMAHLLTNQFEEIGFEKGFLYGLAFANDMARLQTGDIQ